MREQYSGHVISLDQSQAGIYLEQRLSGLPGQERQKLTVGVMMLRVILSKVTIRVIRE